MSLEGAGQPVRPADDQPLGPHRDHHGGARRARPARPDRPEGGLDGAQAAGLVRPEPALDQVHVSQKTGDEAARRALVELAGRADLDEAPAFHHTDAVGERHRLLRVVGDDDEAGAEPPLDRPQLPLRLLPQGAVEGAQRLVEQQQLRLACQSAGERHPLPLPARQCFGASRFEAFEPHELHQPGDPLGRLLPAQPQALEPVADIGRHAHMRKQRVGLEHHVDRPPMRRQRGQVRPVEPDRARIRRLEAGDEPQQGALAAARRAEQAENLATREIEGDAVDGRLRAEAFGDPLDTEQRGGGGKGRGQDDRSEARKDLAHPYHASSRSASCTRASSRSGRRITRAPRVRSIRPSPAITVNSRVTCSRRQPMRAASTWW